MLARSLPLLLILAGCPDPTAAPEGGGMSDKPMGGGEGGPGAEGGQPGGPGMGGPPPGGEGGQPGGPGMGGPPPGGGGRPQAPGFQVTAGQGVKLSGTVAYSGSKTGTFRIDFLRQGENASFPDLVHTIALDKPGPWEVEAPKDAGDFLVVSFLDANDNGPDPGEPAARIQDPVKIGSTDIKGLDLTLSDNPELGDLKPGGKDGPGGAGKPDGGMPPQGLPPGGEKPPEGAGAAPDGSMGAPAKDAPAKDAGSK